MTNYKLSINSYGYGVATVTFCGYEMSQAEAIEAAAVIVALKAKLDLNDNLADIEADLLRIMDAEEGSRFFYCESLLVNFWRIDV